MRSTILAGNGQMVQPGTLLPVWIILAGLSAHFIGLLLSNLQNQAPALAMTGSVIVLCAALSVWIGRRDARLGILIAAIAAVRLASATWIFHFGLRDDPTMRIVGDLNGLFDAVRYDYWAQDFILSDVSFVDYFMGARLNTIGIVSLAAAVYSVFGLDPFMVVLLGVFATALTCYYIHRLASRLFGRGVADWSAIIFSLSPDSLSYGGMLMKETVLAFLFVAGCEALLRLKESRTSWLQLFAVVSAMLFFRDGLSLVLGVSAALILAAEMPMRTRMPFIAVLVLLAVSAASFNLTGTGFAFSFDSLDHLLGGYGGDISQLSFVDGYSASFSAAMGLNITFWTLYLLPLKIMMSFLIPFPPWQWLESFHSNMLVLSQWIFLPLLPAAGWRAWTFFRERTSMRTAVFAPLILMLVVNALSGPFIYDRYRFPLLPAVLMFGLGGLGDWSRVRRFYLWSFLVFSLLVTVYYAFKMSRF